jgi:hypothetical protein
MSDTQQSRLHVTGWPGIPLPLPVTYRVESKLTDNGVIVPCPSGRYGHDWEEEPVMLDGETYLRLAAVDLEDPKAIFAFVSEYGILDGAELYHGFMRQAAYLFANMYRAQLDARTEHDKKQGVLRKRDDADATWPSDALWFAFTETLDEFRFAARFLRDLASAWRMYQDGKQARDIQWLSPQQSVEPEFFQEDGFPLFLLSNALPSSFLRAFSPRLTFYWTPPLPAGPAYSDLPPRREGINVDPTREPIGAPLYAICALELYNHIIENAEYLICGNENCRQKNFVHQQGRKKNWHRSNGVLYCSPACAHAVAQRQYRRRVRHRQAGGEG